MSRGDAIPLYARIALIAQVIDVFRTASGSDAARREARHRAGSWFDPRLVDAFERVAARPEFWDAMDGGNLQRAIYALEPAQSVRLVDEDYLDDIAEAFAQVVDSKSPYTSGHSTRVTLFADLIAEDLSFSPERRRWLRRASLLLDIGKLGVSNTILDKPGKLDEAEWTAMRMHAAHSETILSQIEVFKELAPIASAHHERLDGKGYPRGLRGDAIVLETRVITTADIFDALTADRPYRPAMPVSKAFAIMDEMVGTQIDGDCLAALKRSLRRVGAPLAA